MNDLKIFASTNSKKNFISIFLALFVLYLVFSNFDLKKSYQIINNANFFALTFALIFHYLIIPIRAFRWRLQLEKIGLTLPISYLTKTLFFAQFFNGILPAKLGEFYRAHTLKKNHGLSISKNIGLIFIERVIDLIILIIFTIFSAYSLFGKNIPPIIKNSILITSIIMGMIIFFIIILKYNYLNTARILPNFINKKVDVFIKSATIPLNIFLPLVMCSIIIWTLEIISLYLCTVSIGYPISIWLAIFTTLTSSLLTAIPITPAGTGAVEIGVLGIFSLVGIESTVAVTILILFRVISYWSHIIFGFIAYIFSKNFNL